MYLFLYDILLKIGLGSFATLLAVTLNIVIVICLCIGFRFLLKFAANKTFDKLTSNRKIPLIDIFLENKLFSRLSYLVFPVIISIFAEDAIGKYLILKKAVDGYIIVIIILVLNSCFKSIGTIYSAKEISKTFPIRGLLQVIEIAAIIIGGIVVISILVDKNPMTLIGGLGALTAVISLIFKDAIMGFIAGIQLTANDMIKIGDWIEVPNHSANGTVIDLTMTTVKVENFDKTVTLIPAYTLVTEAFINWRGMIKTGARRIKRAIYIDVTGIRVCDQEMINKLKNIPLLKNKTFHSEITNIGAFRIFVSEYLKHRQGINKDLPMIVRQLEPGEKGIPLEIYAFTNTTVWAEYENIQSDIFDYLYAVIPEFNLNLYQNISSRSILKI